MARRRLKLFEYIHILEEMRAGTSSRVIAEKCLASRNKARGIRETAQAHGWLDPSAPMPTSEDINRAFPAPPVPIRESCLEPYREKVAGWVEAGYAPKQIFRELKRQAPSFNGSVGAVKRFLRSLGNATPKAFVVLHFEAGEAAQVDFGSGPLIQHPHTEKPTRTHFFVMTLCHSRHMYVELVWDQKVETWLRCHRKAFEFFGGVPHKIGLDNLKTAIIRAYAQDRDPEIQRAYAECAEHYGFLVDPCLPARPQHKGKVERGGVGYVQRSFMPLLPANTPLPEANARVQRWLLTRAGLREHGTTHEAPLTRFETVERAKLLPLPPTAYDLATWQRAKLHRDGYVVFEKSFYSAPSRLVGQTLWLRAGLRELRLFTDDFNLVATHSRAAQPGQRLTHPDHVAPGKARGLTVTRSSCQADADLIGPATAQVVAELLAHRPLDRLRTAVRILALAERYTPARLEAACRRGLAFGDTSLPALKRILAEGLDQVELLTPAASVPPDPPVFARTPAELAEAILGGAAWN